MAWDFLDKLFGREAPNKKFTGGGGSFDGGGASGGEEWNPKAKAKVTEAAKAATSSSAQFQKVTAQSPKIVDVTPPAPTASASQVKAATGAPEGGNIYMVSLREQGTENIVYFQVMPEIVEQHTAEYEAIAPAQFPGAFQKYKGTPVTQWTLNATLIARNSGEADQNLRDLNTLRGWMMPFYGVRSMSDFPGKTGAPPPVLELRGLRDLIGPVPVVITSMNWNWPKDVDYIATNTKGPDGNLIPFPVIIQLPIQLVESYAIDQFNSFSLADYRAGKMPAAFNKIESSGGAARTEMPEVEVPALNPVDIPFEVTPARTRR